MSEDLLERATKALREQGGAEPPSDRAAFMRARVLSQAKRSSKLRPQGIWQWAAVVSLGFFVSTAMAQVIAVQLPRVIEALRHDSAEEVKPKPPSKRPSKPPQPKAAPAAASGEAEPEAPLQPEAAAPTAPEPAPAPPAVPVAPPQPRRAPRALPKPALSANIPPAKPIEPPPPAAAPEPKPAPAAQAPEPAQRNPKPKAAAPEPAELALFRRAQALHVAHDPSAIAAWDAFLRVAGSSVLAPEARYNRALGLVRASRFAEARRALQPFAAGAYGSYRKDEARALLARLPE